MNFNYSYRAFLITSLLVGNLVLLMVSVKLHKKEEPEEKGVPIEYAEELLEEELAVVSTEDIKIETHSAYNEAEQFIRELENERNAETLNEEETSQEIEESSEIDTSSNDIALTDAKDHLEKMKEKLSKKRDSNKSEDDPTAVNRKTTISYLLNGRKALSLRNPVYTCESGGAVVVNIEVNALGNVTKASYNKQSSTTTNGCLIESALTYARRAKFTTKSDKPKQLGTITYLFPGQH
ncbi:hypothetical protein POV27_01780 [Aureisphaera galaxeae]|uniref:hypothetical protein n=1 Tax=Aureisphaera galaxeae TaxID=1538023 RepID=UPI0023507AF0|nr:hypothetical protein [Aureisphaera galaxeae]MDC8002770.1 hypothetical protein [Aureisphaera galaxeae]